MLDKTYMVVGSQLPNAFFIAQSMSESLRRKQPFKALKLFKYHLRTRLNNGVTLALASKACAGDQIIGTQIHGFAVVSGLVNRITVFNSLMSMYIKGDMLNKALSLFEKSSCPDTVSWNTILSGFQTSEEAIPFALRMSSSGTAFDAFTYTTAISFCNTPFSSPFAHQLHCGVVKSGFLSDVFVSNALITMHSRLGSAPDARKVFDAMPSRDRVSWCAMITGYTQEVIHAEEAIVVFVGMIKEGMSPDHVAFTGVISACGHVKDLLLGRQSHAMSIKSGCGEHISVGNVLMSMYSKNGAPEEVSLVFEEMNDHNVVSWTTMISVHQNDAVFLFTKMMHAVVSPNDVTLVSLLSAINTKEMSEQGKTAHGYCLKSGFISEKHVRSSLVTMYANLESVQESRKVFDEIEERNIIAWNSLISGYVHNALYQNAVYTFLQVLEELKPSEYTFGSVLSAVASAEDISILLGRNCHSQIIKQGLFPHAEVSNALLDMYAKRGSICDAQKVFDEIPQQCQFSWTAIISAYARHGDFSSVLRAFAKMRANNVTPDSITFLSILTACARKGMVDKGKEVFLSMVREYKIEAMQEHYSCMVDMMGRAGRLEEAEEVLESVQAKRGLSMLQSLLNACRIHGNTKLGEKIADELLEMEPEESGSYVLMSNIYAEKGLWEKAAKVRKVMRKKGVKKEVGFSWLDIGNVDDTISLHKFASGDKSHKQCEDIFSMASCLELEMKFLWERDGSFLQIVL